MCQAVLSGRQGGGRLLWGGGMGCFGNGAPSTLAGLPYLPAAFSHWPWIPADGRSVCPGRHGSVPCVYFHLRFWAAGPGMLPKAGPLKTFGVTSVPTLPNSKVEEKKHRHPQGDKQTKGKLFKFEIYLEIKVGFTESKTLSPLAVCPEKPLKQDCRFCFSNAETKAARMWERGTAEWQAQGGNRESTPQGPSLWVLLWEEFQWPKSPVQAPYGIQSNTEHSPTACQSQAPWQSPQQTRNVPALLNWVLLLLTSKSPSPPSPASYMTHPPFLLMFPSLLVPLLLILE